MSFQASKQLNMDVVHLEDGLSVLTQCLYSLFVDSQHDTSIIMEILRQNDSQLARILLRRLEEVFRSNSRSKLLDESQFR